MWVRISFWYLTLFLLQWFVYSGSTLFVAGNHRAPFQHLNLCNLCKLWKISLCRFSALKVA